MLNYNFAYFRRFEKWSFSIFSSTFAMISNLKKFAIISLLLLNLHREIRLLFFFYKKTEKDWFNY